MVYIQGQQPMSPAGNAPNLANRVRERRTKCGLTQEVLGLTVGLTRQSVIAIEQGRFTPSVHTALRLAAALGTTVDELFWLTHDLRSEE
jgi:putative transcriptional regulator